MKADLKIVKNHNNSKKEYLLPCFLLVCFFIGLIIGIENTNKDNKEIKSLFFMFTLFKDIDLSFVFKSAFSFMFYLLPGFFFSTSFVGFILIPFECILLGFSVFTSYYEVLLILDNKASLLYLPLIALYSGFLLIYLSFCTVSSFKIYKELCFKENESIEIRMIFKRNIKVFYFSLIIAAVFTFIYCVTIYLLI